ncbi:MAG: TlpA family protein disulfide reductase [Candidatus Kapabacteria bacterium]|nr:TlpA family protein disulfide reductase [Candidatus Kapabacteria bacterium]
MSVLSLLIYQVDARQLTGYCQSHIHEEISLYGFNGLENYLLSQSETDSNGNFVLEYPEDYTGIGYIKISDTTGFYLVLHELDINVNITYTDKILNVDFTNSYENKIFKEYAVQHTQRENALSAWRYLQQLYDHSDLLNKDRNYKKLIDDEIESIKYDDYNYLINLEKATYVSWYLPKRKLLDDMSNSIKISKEDIPKYVEQFREIDLDDLKLIRSGLYQDLLICHFILIEKMNIAFDSILYEMNISIDYIIENLSRNNILLSKTALYLFNMFEKRSLIKSSEYLALAMLSNESCLLDTNVAKRFETYRKMKEGKIAPDFVFNDDIFKNGVPFTSASSLSQINSKYKLIIFGASWCETCTSELSSLMNLYDKMKSKSIEVIFVSLDTEQSQFKKYSSKFPFISYCDYQKWNSRPVMDYLVFATPTIFLLDSKNQIFKRPISIEHVKSIVDSME